MEALTDNIWVVIPSFNEIRVLPDVLSVVCQQKLNVILVDDGSSDETGRVAEKFKVHYLRHRINLGQGAALQTGMRYALAAGAQTVVTMDADGQMDPADIPALCAALEKNNCDVALGTRFSSARPNEIPAVRKCLLRVALVFTRVMTGLALTDTHNGFRAFRRSALEKINISQNGMAHASEILSQIARSKLSFVEVPVSIRYSAYALGKGQRSFNAFNILWELFFQ